MSPPWVQFDSAAALGGDCKNGSDPDIAGIGVVLSFVLASIMTTTASILAMLLDHAHDGKGKFSLLEPRKYIRERFFDTEWKKEYAWRPFLDPLIIGLGDQQLITGYAVLFSGWIKVAQKSFTVQGAHFVLVLYVCALSSSSHLAALITLRKYFRRYKLIAKIRMSLVVFFATFLFCSMIAAIAMPLATISNHNGVVEKQQRVQRLSFLVPMFFMICGFSTALVCILYRPARTGLARWTTDSPKEIMTPPVNIGLKALWYLFFNPLIAFIVQIVLAILSGILVLSQKFAVSKDKEKWCGLQDSGENNWGFGQTLSMVMLLLPVMSATLMYLEGRQDISEGHRKGNDR